MIYIEDTSRRTAISIVNSIIADLYRRDLPDEWGQLSDAQVKEEIFSKWTLIAERVIKDELSPKISYQVQILKDTHWVPVALDSSACTFESLDAAKIALNVAMFLANASDGELRLISFQIGDE